MASIQEQFQSRVGYCGKRTVYVGFHEMSDKVEIV